MKPINGHLKKIVDDLVEIHGIEYCISRAYKLNEMNKHLLESHIADGDETSEKITQMNIDDNNTAIEYLKELLKQKQNDK